LKFNFVSGVEQNDQPIFGVTHNSTKSTVGQEQTQPTPPVPSVAMSTFSVGVSSASSIFGGGTPKFSFGALASGTASVPKLGFGGGFKEQKAKPMFGATPDKLKSTASVDKEPVLPSDDENPEVFEANVDFKPVCPLPDKIEVLTGEENETVCLCKHSLTNRVFCSRCSRIEQSCSGTLKANSRSVV
jgi:hypothetical protein